MESIEFKLLDFTLMLVGLLTILAFMLVRAKAPYDDLDLQFKFRKYAMRNIDNWIFDLLAGISLVLIGESIYVWYMEVWSQKVPEGTARYPMFCHYFAGAFGSLIVEGIYRKLRKKIDGVDNLPFAATDNKGHVVQKDRNNKITDNENNDDENLQQAG